MTAQHHDRIRAFASVHAVLAAAPSGDCRHEKECFCAIRVADALMPECTNDEWAAAKVAASALLRVGLSGRTKEADEATMSADMLALGMMRAAAIRAGDPEMADRYLQGAT